jgi:trehalose 6-phosphate synthase/phosphatase
MTRKGHVTLAVTPNELRERLTPLLNGSPRVLLLDYDGTLQPIAAIPDLARPDADLLHLLQRLGTRPDTIVHVISGRPRDVLDRWLGQFPFALWAEHGFWHRPAGTVEWVATAPLRAGWRDKVEPIVARFTDATPGSSTEFKSASLSWHYRLADPEFGRQQAQELRKQLVTALRHEPLEAREGKKVIEVRSRSAHKGLPIRLILEESGPSAVLIAVGDDTTDEDMFAAIPANGASVHVGNEPTLANYRLADPEAVRQWLNLIIAAPVHP